MTTEELESLLRELFATVRDNQAWLWAHPVLCARIVAVLDTERDVGFSTPEEE